MIVLKNNYINTKIKNIITNIKNIFKIYLKMLKTYYILGFLADFYFKKLKNNFKKLTTKKLFFKTILRS